MNRTVAFKTATLLIAALCLNGCVIAAIPVVAGAAVARTATDGEKPGDEERAEAAQQKALDAQLKLAELAAAPAPESIQIAEPSATPSELVESDAYAALIRYASDQAQSSPQAEAPQSAILLDPTSLREKRAPCLTNLPTVLIDLDPEDGQFALENSGTASPTFVEGLAQLREANISVAWISSHLAADADGIRVALKRSGLDPNSEDQLLLMRYPGDRKQTRRDDLANVSCVIAIAGDSRTDFNELFEYLVKPEAALALELLIGQGWFLIPQALTQPSSQTTRSTN